MYLLLLMSAAYARSRCVIVDTDMALDDLRAISLAATEREVAAVVVTEGVARVPEGWSAAAAFLAVGGSDADLIAGEASRAPTADPWLDDVRAASERLNGYLAVALPGPQRQEDLVRALRDAVRGCGRVDVLVLGPWTSFVTYARHLRLGVVVGSGSPSPEDFNCGYDVTSCVAAASDPALSITWVDLPNDADYAPNPGMFTSAGAGLPALTAIVHAQNEETWRGTRLWDDAAALYLISPESFNEEGVHSEPAVSGADMLQAISRYWTRSP